MRKFLVLILALSLYTWALSAQSPTATLIMEHDGGVVTATWNPSETQILTASEEGLVQVWSADDGELILTINHDGNPLTHAFWLDGGTTILSADESGFIKTSTTETGEMLQSWQIEGMPLTIDLSTDESSVFVFTSAGIGAIWSLDDSETILSVSRNGTIVGAGWNADETQIRAWSEEGQVVVWDVASGLEQATFSLSHQGILLGLAWNQDDSKVLAWYADGSLALYESDGISANDRIISRFFHQSFVQSAMWSDDELTFMSWAGDDTVNIWNVSGGNSELALRHEDWVTGARWDASESQVLSWSHIYLYVWVSGELTERFEHDNLVRGAVWNSDATRVLSWSWDGTARVWEL